MNRGVYQAMVGFDRRVVGLAILVAWMVGGCSELSTSGSPLDIVTVLTEVPVLLAVALIALVGLVSATMTRADRTRWSLSMKVFLALIGATLASIPLAVIFGLPPPP